MWSENLYAGNYGTLAHRGPIRTLQLIAFSSVTYGKLLSLADGTLAEREAIDRIQKIGLAHSVLAHKAVQLG